MSSFAQVYDLHNLRRAYRWVLSSQDTRYKSYFRDDYAAYALASDSNLRLLRRRMRDGTYSASHASKVYVPKTSGVLRPLTLLTINDQIAYQACLNVIADELQKRTSKRHGRSVFYHLYAGPSSPFFYRKWESAYRSYSNAIRSSFKSGLTHVATFDLTAFYDSIDHQVLRHFLRRSGVDQDTIAFLLGCLKHWTEATWSNGDGALIFHDHGIPQGPISSGMLSEVMLQHLDAVGDRKSKDVRYLRYVDDIKIMARDEKTLRRKLVALDVAAKHVGLFPQGSKIAIRRVSDPEEEIKSVSRPPELVLRPGAETKDLHKRIKELAGGGNPPDPTRFKYVLSALKPSSTTNAAVLAVLFKRPDLSEAITRHFSRYKKLPAAVSGPLSNEVCAEGVYHSVNADILGLLYGRVDATHTARIADFAYERLFARKYRSGAFAAPQPTYAAALIRWALLSSRLTYPDLLGHINGERDWWVLQNTLAGLDDARFGKPSFEALLNAGMRRAEPDAARVAASSVFSHSLQVHKPSETCAWSARILLRFVGLVPYAGRPPSLIASVLAYAVKFDERYDWRKLFGKSHGAAERLAILSKQRYETDIDAFVVSLDSLCDLVTRQVFAHRGERWRSTYGNLIGAGAPAWLRSDYPKLIAGFYKLHQLRIHSFTAHPRHTSGELNKRITHRQYYRARKDIVAAFAELCRILPM